MVELQRAQTEMLKELLAAAADPGNAEAELLKALSAFRTSIDRQTEALLTIAAAPPPDSHPRPEGPGRTNTARR